MNTKYISIVVGFIALGGVGYYIYSDMVREPSGSPSVSQLGNTITGTSSSPEGAVSGNGSNSSTASGSGEGNSNTLPVPRLDRFVINAQVTNVKRAALDKALHDLSVQVTAEGKFEQWLDLASYRKVAEDYEGAGEIWEYMTKRYPNDRTAFVNLGNLYHFYLKDFPKAESYMLAAIGLGQSPASDYIDLYELYTLSYKEKENKADDILLKGLEELPNNPDLSFTLAAYYAEQGNITGARKYYQIVLDFARQQGDKNTEERIQAAVAKL
jgi:tetratricopeptide (TPR) repeat protein